MPRIERKRHAKRRNLNLDDVWHRVVIGYGIPPDPEIPDNQLQEVWDAFKDELMAAWFRDSVHHGRRPIAWWWARDMDAPDSSIETTELRRLGQLLPAEEGTLRQREAGGPVHVSAAAIDDYFDVDDPD